MVQERYDDLDLGSAGYESSGWRCLNCGAIVDPVIAAHHQITRKTEPSHSWQERLKKLLMAA
jgi:hypothetical protein